MVSPEAAASVGLAAVACVFDWRSRRIPNALTMSGLVAGVAFAGFTGGVDRALWSLGGGLTGAALFFPFFALGGMGAGDVKLAGALGSWLGPAGALWLVLYSAICGGVFGVAVALLRGYLKTACRNVLAIIGFWGVTGVRPVEGLTLVSSRGPKLPYALPIAAGLLLTHLR